jgi:hypothetical protein
LACGGKEFVMNTILKSLGAALTAVAMIAVPVAADAAHGGMGGGGGGAMGNGGGWHGGSSGGGSWHGGGYYHGGYWHGGYWHGGCCGYGYWPYWGAVGVGLAIGYGAYYGGYPYYGYPYYGYGYPAYGYPAAGDDPGYAAAPPTTTTTTHSSGQPVPSASSHAPDPIFYPRNGQSAAKTDADRQECNRWATTQSGAMNDASIFQRATFACMEGRGYTVG